MDFEKVIAGLEKTRQNKHVITCLDAIRSGTVFFRRGFSKEASELTSLYHFRLNIAKNKADNKLSAEEIDAWEVAIESMTSSEAETFHLNTILTEKQLFMLFWNDESHMLIGLLFFNTDHYKQAKNLEVGGAVKYIKGEKASD